MAHKTEAQIRYNMKRVKGKDSQIELILRRELWKRGIRYRKNVSTILGKPDIAFLRKKVAVFCDSEFWHGYDWEHHRNDIKSHQDFWIPKIEKNIERDKIVSSQLMQEGWVVLRFWGNDIKKNPSGCADIIEDVLRNRK